MSQAAAPSERQSICDDLADLADLDGPGGPAPLAE
jgi:hypothetical protein